MIVLCDCFHTFFPGGSSARRLLLCCYVCSSARLFYCSSAPQLVYLSARLVSATGIPGGECLPPGTTHLHLQRWCAFATEPPCSADWSSKLCGCCTVRGGGRTQQGACSSFCVAGTPGGECLPPGTIHLQRWCAFATEPPCSADWSSKLCGCCTVRGGGRTQQGACSSFCAAGTPGGGECLPPGTTHLHLQVVCLCNGAAIQLLLVEQALRLLHGACSHARAALRRDRVGVGELGPRGEFRCIFTTNLPRVVVFQFKSTLLLHVAERYQQRYAPGAKLGGSLTPAIKF